MKKRPLHRRTQAKHINSWVPFLDTSIFPDIFTFGCVKGPSRFFLQIEMILALLIVIGSCMVVISKYL